MRRAASFGALVTAGLVGCSLVTSLDGLTGGGIPVSPSSESGAPVVGDGGLRDAFEETTPAPACDAAPIDPKYLNDAIEVSVGDGFACALRTNGTVVCWGGNVEGELGFLPPVDSDDLSARPLVVHGIPKAVHVSSGFVHACIIDEASNVWCWGASERVGAGPTEGALSPPVMVIDGTGAPLRDVVAIGAGRAHSCAIKTGGSVVCWGATYLGQVGPLGTGNIVDHAVPVPSIDDAIELAVGQEHTCVLRGTSPREIDCWGWGAYGQLGVVPDGAAAWSVVTPLEMDLAGSGASAPSRVSAGYRTTCIVDDRGNVFATGANNKGQIGALSVGTELDTVTAVQNFSDQLSTQVASGSDHTCVLRANRTAECIGVNLDGQLGRGTVSEKETVPVPVVGLGWDGGADASVLQDVIALSVGGADQLAVSCALVRPACATSGSVVCWGNNGGGNLGAGTLNAYQPPTRVIAP